MSPLTGLRHGSGEPVARGELPRPGILAAAFIRPNE